jgi:glucokinase
MLLARTAHDAIALVGHVGRKKLSFALTDEQGALRRDTIRSYDPQASSSIAGAISLFGREMPGSSLPKRSAIAVAGLARGETISITKTPWIMSRSGLAAMLGHPPVIVNDFAAEAWALFSADVQPQEMFGMGAKLSLRRPGCYCVMGMTSGLGVSVLSLSAAGMVNVLPTEAGHGGFVAATDELATLAADLFPGRYPVPIEEIISAPGLLLIYRAVAGAQSLPARAESPEDVTRTVNTDRAAFRACELLSQAFWSCASSLAVTYGAWDGVVVTGRLAAATLPFLRRPEMGALFAGTGKYQRALQAVPRGFVSLEQGELIGAAEALRHHGSEAAGSVAVRS